MGIEEWWSEEIKKEDEYYEKVRKLELTEDDLKELIDNYLVVREPSIEVLKKIEYAKELAKEYDEIAIALDFMKEFIEKQRGYDILTKVPIVITKKVPARITGAHVFEMTSGIIGMIYIRINNNYFVYSSIAIPKEIVDYFSIESLSITLYHEALHYLLHIYQYPFDIFQLGEIMIDKVIRRIPNYIKYIKDKDRYNDAVYSWSEFIRGYGYHHAREEIEKRFIDMFDFEYLHQLYCFYYVNKINITRDVEKYIKEGYDIGYEESEYIDYVLGRRIPEDEIDKEYYKFMNERLKFMKAEKIGIPKPWRK